jgi:CHC2 zinc finger
MTGPHFDNAEKGELRAKIDEAKRRLPLPDLMKRLGLGAHAKKSARCPFPGHKDQHKSFSVFKGDDGFWRWKCHSRCGDGDEIMFLRKLKGVSLTDAMNVYLEMAGFPAHVPHKSREYPEVPKVLGSPKSLNLLEFPCVSCASVSPVSNGQGLHKELEEELKDLATRNACTRRIRIKGNDSSWRAM